MAQVLVACSDLFFQTKIAEILRGVGMTGAFPRHPAALVEAAHAEAPRVVLVDLSSLVWRESLGALRADDTLSGVPFVAFYNHHEPDVKRAADEAGCAEVLTRNAFSARLADILRRYMTPGV
jgi:CheY-like chemotaxis protein